MNPVLVYAAFRATRWALKRWNQRSRPESSNGKANWYTVPAHRLGDFLQCFPNAIRASSLLVELKRQGHDSLIPDVAQHMATVQMQDPNAVVMVVVDD